MEVKLLGIWRNSGQTWKVLFKNLLQRQTLVSLKRQTGQKYFKEKCLNSVFKKRPQM
jgi:hypothetical protein